MGKARNILTAKQERFCLEYLVDLNATQAAIRAGYSPKTANEQAARLLVNVSVQDYISKLKSQTAKKLEITKDMVVAECAKIGFSSIASLHNSWIERKQFDALTPDQKAAIAEISTQTRKMQTDGGQVVEVEFVKIKLHDKLKSLEMLTRLLGFNEPEKKDVSITGLNIVVANNDQKKILDDL